MICTVCTKMNNQRLPKQVYNEALKGAAEKQFQVFGNYVKWKEMEELHVADFLYENK